MELVLFVVSRECRVARLLSPQLNFGTFSVLLARSRGQRGKGSPVAEVTAEQGC